MYYVESSKALTHCFVAVSESQPFSIAYLGNVPSGTPEEFIAHCFDECLIVEASALSALAQRYPKEHFQQMCVQHGLPEVGVKAELIDRLRVNVPSWYENETKNCQFWQLTATGSSLAARLSARIKFERRVIENRLSELLMHCDTASAWMLWAAWNAEEPYPVTVDDRYDGHGFRPVDEREFVLVAEDAYRAMRRGDAAAFLTSLLMGESRIYGKSPLSLDNRLRHQQYLKQLHETPGVIGVKIEPPKRNKCTMAALYAGKYPLDKAPQWPPALCTNEPGCGCCLIGIFEEVAPVFTPARPSAITTPPPPPPALPTGLKSWKATRQCSPTEAEDETPRKIPDPPCPKPKILAIPAPKKR